MRSYVLVGCGGTGSNFVGQGLAYLETYHRNRDNEEWQMILIDGDDLEDSNLSRQMFDAQYIGQNKALALADMYRRYPVVAIPRFIGENDLPTIIYDGDVVFIGADNHSIRALIQQHALTLKNSVVINAGNEMHDGTVQLWVREGGKNKTPVLSYAHPEIRYQGAEDRSFMTCAQVAELPGGGQILLANMAAATYMLHALWRYHEGTWKSGWSEVYFNLKDNTIAYLNQRERRNWFRSPKMEIE